MEYFCVQEAVIFRDFIKSRMTLHEIQMSTMKCPDYGDVLNIGKFFSGGKDLLHTTGIQIIAYFFKLSYGLLL
jgi:hypothetical protein